MSQIIQILNKYGGSSAHYKYNGKAFVSTFEGPEAAEDWVTIKQAINCFFVPDWSSLGAKAALGKLNYLCISHPQNLKLKEESRAPRRRGRWTILMGGLAVGKARHGHVC
jgi:hypothetical protein